ARDVSERCDDAHARLPAVGLFEFGRTDGSAARDATVALPREPAPSEIFIGGRLRRSGRRERLAITLSRRFAGADGTWRQRHESAERGEDLARIAQVGSVEIA